MPNNINISDYEKIIFVNNISEENSVVKNRNYNFAVFFTNDANIPVNWPETAWGSTIRNIWYGGQRLNRFIGIDKDNCTLNVGDHTVKLTFDYDKGLLGISDTNKLESIEILKLSYVDAYDGLNKDIIFSNISTIPIINSINNEFDLIIRFHVLEEAGANINRIANGIIIKCESNRSNIQLLNYVNEEIKDNGLTADRKYHFKIIYDTEVNYQNNQLYTVIPNYDNNITNSKNLKLRLNPTSIKIYRKNGSVFSDDLSSNRGILSENVTEEYKVEILPNSNELYTYPASNNLRKLYIEISSSNGDAVTINDSVKTIDYVEAGTNFNLILKKAPDNETISSTINVTLRHDAATSNPVNRYFTNLNKSFTINITGRTQIPQYTVYFNGNGGTSTLSQITVNAGTRIGTLPSATRSGYNFVGWFTTANGGSEISASYTVNSDGLTVYAHWTEIPVTTYTITFNGNGGSVSGSTTKTINEGSAVGTLPSATRSGYNFVGWNTSSTATTANVSTDTVPTGNVTYYAIWSVIPVITYTVYFNGNGGTSTLSQITVNEGSRIGTLPSATRSGYNFIGWNTSSTATTANISANTVPTGNVTYYAVWEAIPIQTYTVTFDGNGGSVSGSTTKTINEGSAVGTLPSATRSGYNFVGWNTSSTATTANVSANTVPTGNVTYYAIWEVIPVIPDYYWYAGINPINASTVPGSDSNWHAISGTPRSIETGDLYNPTRVHWVLAIPTATGLTSLSNGAELVNNSYDINTLVLADGVEYTIFTQVEDSKRASLYFVSGD